MAKPYLTFNITESNINPASNTSDVTVQLIWNDPAGLTYNASTYCSLTVNGETTTWTVNLPKTNRKVLGSVTKRVVHNPAGDKAISISAYCDASQYWGRTSASTSKVLTTIKRATNAPTLTGMWVNRPYSFSISPSSTGFNHKAYFKLDGKTYLMSGGAAGNNTISWTPPADIADNYPDSSVTKEGVFTLETYNGSSYVGSSSSRATLRIGTEFRAKIGDIILTENNADIKAKFNLQPPASNPTLETFIEKKSVIGVDIRGDYTTSHGGKIKECKVKFGNTTYHGESVEIPAGALNIPYKPAPENPNGATTRALEETVLFMTVEIVDSRGFMSAMSRKFVLVPYRKPKIDSVELEKMGVNADITAVKVKYTISPIRKLNDKSLTVRYKKITEEVYPDANIHIFNNLAYQGEVGVMLDITDPEVTYEYTIELTDYFDKDKVSKTTGQICISRLAGGKGVSLFKPAENEGFWVDGVDYTVNERDMKNMMTLLGSRNPQPPYEFKDLLLRLASHVHNVDEYISDSGESSLTSGSEELEKWAWRKTTNSNIEVWGKVNYKNLAISSASGNLHYADGLKSVVPDSVPLKSIDFAFANTAGSLGLVGASVSGVAAKTVNYRIWGSARMTWNGSVYLYIKGKWR